MMRNTYAETFLLSLWNQVKKEDFILKGSRQNGPFWPSNTPRSLQLYNVCAAATGYICLPRRLNAALHFT